MNGELSRAAEGVTPGVPRPTESESLTAVAHSLARAALGVERAISMARVVFFGAIVAHVALTPQPAPLAAVVVALPLLVGIAFSIAILVAVRHPPERPHLFIASVSVDALAAFTGLLPYALWPTPDYAGVLSLPELTGIYIAIVAAGFRLSPGAAIWGAALNFLGFLTLTLIDHATLGPRLGAGIATVSMIAIFIVAFGMLTVIIATSTRRLVRRGALAAVRSDRAEQGLGAMLAGHHDVRSLLTAITLGAERLAQELERDDAERSRLQQLARTLAADLHRMRQIVQGIQARARSERAGFGPREAVAIGPVAERVAAQVTATHPGVAIDVALAPDACTVLVSGGAPTLHRLLLNLFANACEGRGAKHASAVRLETRLDGNQRIRLEVSDDGPGFSAPQLEQGLQPASDKSGGTGLGLSVVRGLVEASGGTLRLENVAEGGARVSAALLRAPLER